MNFDFTPYLIIGMAILIILGIAGKGYIEEWGRQRAMRKEKKIITSDDCPKCKEEIMNKVKEVIETETSQMFEKLNDEMRKIRQAIIAVCETTKVPFEKYKDLIQ